MKNVSNKQSAIHIPSPSKLSFAPRQQHFSILWFVPPRGRKALDGWSMSGRRLGGLNETRERKMHALDSIFSFYKAREQSCRKK
jgi:hypothetical protein